MLAAILGVPNAHSCFELNANTSMLATVNLFHIVIFCELAS